MKRVCIIGGGITGLATAWRVQEHAPGAELVILEKSDRLGGKIQTVRGNRCVLETGAWQLDAAAMLPLSRWLRKDLDLDDQVLPAASLESFTWSAGELRPRKISPPFPFPLDPEEIADCDLLSDAGIDRASGEASIPPGEDDETVDAFFERRFGAEYVEALLTPWFQSVFIASPAEFSMRGAFPQLIELEHRFGSLTKAQEKAAKLGRLIPPAALAQLQTSKILKSWFSRDPLAHLGSPKVALCYGMSEIVASLSERLRHTVSLNETAERLVKTDRGWLVVTNHRRVYCDTAVLATPLHVAGKLLTAEFPDIASRIATSKAASGAIVNLVLGKDANDLRGKEILISSKEGTVLRSVQCVSDRFPDWAADDCTVIRIVAGSLPTPMPSDEQILSDCLEEVKTKLNIDLKPDFSHVQAFPSSYPVYGLGHCELVADIRTQASTQSGLCVCGDGIVAGGIPGVIKDAFEQIDALIE